MTPARASLFATWLLAGACGDNRAADPGDDGGDDDGGGGDDDGGGGEEELPGLSAREHVVYVGVDGVERRRPHDMSRAIVAAQYDRGDRWEIFPGYGDSTGAIQVPRAPDGAHWLRVDRYNPDPEAAPFDEYLWTDAAEVDYSQPRIGRPDIKYAAQATPLVVDATGLEPWTANDLMATYSANLSYVNFVRQAIGSALINFPGAGATTLSAMTWNWAAFGAPLIDAGLGDRATWLQYRLFDASGILYYAPITSFEATPYTQVDGTTTRLTGTFTRGEPIAYRLAWKRSAFEALRSAVNPTAAQPSLGHAFALEASPGLSASEWRWQTLPTEVISFDSESAEGRDDIDLGELTAYSPFPRETTYSLHEVSFPVELAVDGGVLPLNAMIGQYDTRFPTADEPVVPLVSPPTAPRIAGRDAWQAQRGVGLAPEIAWQPPATGKAQHYVVTIAAAGGADPVLGFGWTRAAVLIVPGDVTAIRVPVDVLVAGRPYALLLRAVSQPDIDIRKTPYRRAMPYAYADAITATFTP